MPQFHKIFTELTMTYPNHRCAHGPTKKRVLQVECTCALPMDNSIDLSAVCLLYNTCGLTIFFFIWSLFTEEANVYTYS